MNGVSAESSAELLLGGQKLLLRGHAHSGRTTSLNATIASVADTGCFATTVNASTLMPDLRRTLALLTERADQDGCSVLGIDDLDLIIFSSDGTAKHALLNATLAHPAFGKSIGAVATALHGTQLVPARSNVSTVYDLIQVESAQPLETRDTLRRYYMNRFACSAADADKLVGTYGACLRLATVGSLPSRMDVEKFCIRVCQRMVSSEGADLARLAARQKIGQMRARRDGDEVLHPLAFDDGGRLRIPEVVYNSTWLSLLLGTGEPWPQQMREAAARFACRVGPARRAVWVDRYLGQRAKDMVRFVDRLAQYLDAGTTLDVLTSVDIARDAPADFGVLLGRIAHWRTQGLTVRIRQMTGPIASSLHDRQLLFPNERGGFSLPPADRTMCSHAAGNSTDSYLPSPPVEAVLHGWEGSNVIA